MIKSEKLEYGKAADEIVDLTEFASNLAFRASYLGGSQDATIDPTIAKWKARIVRKELEYSLDDKNWTDIPVKYCSQQDYASFAPSRLGQRSIIKLL